MKGAGDDDGGSVRSIDQLDRGFALRVLHARSEQPCIVISAMSDRFDRFSSKLEIPSRYFTSNRSSWSRKSRASLRIQRSHRTLLERCAVRCFLSEKTEARLLIGIFQS